MKRIIAHVDMDAFFASVEEREHPWLTGLPIVVGADPKGGTGRGVVSTANYAARKYGIFSATPISRAWRASEKARKDGLPAVAFLTPNFKKYKEISDAVMKCIREDADAIEVTSIDEAYADLSAYRTYARATEISQKIQRVVKERTGLTCSIGVGPNRMIAKIASGKNKPSGLTVVQEEDAYDFLSKLPVSALPGVGPKTDAQLGKHGLRLVEDIRSVSLPELERIVGSFSISLYEYAFGMGETELRTPSAPKSIGEHETLEHDTADLAVAFRVLGRMSKGISTHLRKGGFSGFRTVVLTVRFSDFETRTRSSTSRDPLHSEKELESKAIKLVLPFFEKKENPNGKKIRMFGLRVEKLSIG